MGYANPLRGAVKVDLGPKDDGSENYWVLLRHLTLDESEKMQDIKDDTQKAIEGLATSAVDWNLDDENGVKFAREALPNVIRNMPQGDFLKLSIAFAGNEGMGDDEIAAVSERAKREARATFPGVPGVGDSAGNGGTASTPGLPDTASVVGASGPQT
jgi:hypothetical protein